MRSRIILCVVVAVFLFAAVPASAGYKTVLGGKDGTYLVPDAESITQILLQADQSRGNLKGITWEVVLNSIVKNKTTSSMTFFVKARSFDILAESLAPAKDKGNKLLMINGNMWFYKPGLSKAVPISRRQKLLGNAAYGDIAATNYVDDYDAKILEDEVVDGVPCWVFDLKSKNRRTTYDRVKYWIAKESGAGLKSHFFTVSGKLFKSSKMDYENEIIIGGEKRPFISRITINDELVDRKTTVLEMTKPVLEDLADYIFNLNLLRR